VSILPIRPPPPFSLPLLRTFSRLGLGRNLWEGPCFVSAGRKETLGSLCFSPLSPFPQPKKEIYHFPSPPPPPPPSFQVLPLVRQKVFGALTKRHFPPPISFPNGSRLLKVLFGSSRAQRRSFKPAAFSLFFSLFSPPAFSVPILSTPRRRFLPVMAMFSVLS